jgi:hypothetical protein
MFRSYSRFEAIRIKGEPAIRLAWEHRRSGKRFVGAPHHLLHQKEFRVTIEFT